MSCLENSLGQDKIMIYLNVSPYLPAVLLDAIQWPTLTIAIYGTFAVYFETSLKTCFMQIYESTKVKLKLEGNEQK